MLKVPAIHLDVVLLHAQQADDYGNVQYFGAAFLRRADGAGGEEGHRLVDRIVPSIRSGNRRD